MNVKSYNNFYSIFESKENGIETDSIYGEICVLLDALNVPCEISEIVHKIPNKKIEVTLKNGVVFEINKSNEDDLFSALKVYQTKEDPIPCLSFKNNPSSLLVFDFESDGIPEICEEISFSDFLSNDILRDFLVKKSFGLLSQKDHLDLRAYYDNSIFNCIDPSNDRDKDLNKKFLSVLASFLSPSEIEIYRNS